MTAVEIAEMRRAAGLSQAELARLLEVSVHTVQNWEQGLRRPRGPAILILRELAEGAKARRPRG